MRVDQLVDAGHEGLGEHLDIAVGGQQALEEARQDRRDALFEHRRHHLGLGAEVITEQGGIDPGIRRDWARAYYRLDQFGGESSQTESTATGA